MSTPVYWVYAGGALHLGWALFHVFFPRIFKWSASLEPLDPVNRGIYQILNLCLTFYFFAVGYLSLALADQMLTTPLGRKLWGVLAVFWFFRLGLQFRFFRITHPISLLLSLGFALTLGVHLYPLLAGAL